MVKCERWKIKTSLAFTMASSSSDGWGGDYSFLLQSIEGQISGTIPSQSPAVSRFSLGDESVSKRRWSELQTSVDMPMSSAKKMRSFAELDELTIKNEQLQDSLAKLKSEQQITKDEHIRQLKFLDERCTSLKKESSERLEKYYEEKKKWQSKHRELEAQLKKALEKGGAGGSSTQPPAAASASAVSQANDEILHRLRAMESELATTMQESRENMKAKLTAESKLFEVATELSQLRSSLGAGSMADEALAEARLLRKQFADLESVHKRTAREHEAMKTKLKNQSLLEEEVSTLKAKLRLTEEKLGKYKNVQTELQQLQEERSMWTQLFQEIVAQPENSEMIDDSLSGRGAAAVTPTAVLQLLSAYQSKCAVLLQGQGQLQQSLSEVRRQLREVLSSLSKSDASRSEVEARLETVESQLRAAQQHGRLYDGEVRSLRSLLETYDLEFSIGKPDAAKVLELKDRTIAELRGELDGARASALMSASQAKAAETTLAAIRAEAQSLEQRLADSTAQLSAAAAAPATSQVSSAQLEEQRALAADAQLQLKYLQHVTGLDFLPDRTKVLHLTANPTSHAPSVRTMPTVATLKTLRREAQQHLQLAMAQAQEAAAAAIAAAAESRSEDSRETSADSSSSGAGGSSAANQSMVGGHHLNTSVLASAGHAAAPAVQAVTDSTTMNMRLKEQFKERISSFREGVYLLMGYKVTA